MYLASPNDSLDSLVFGLPLIGLLVFGYFRLDEVFVRKAPKAGAQPPVRTKRYIIEDESEMMHDPDSRQWEKPQSPRY